MTALPVAKPYLGGYFDGAASVVFNINKGERAVGYRIVPTLVVSVVDEWTFGMLDECFDTLDVTFQVQERENVWQLVISSRQSVETLCDVFGPYTHRNHRVFSFVREVFLPAENRHDTSYQRDFYRMILSIEELQPHRRRKQIKYTREYFEEAFELDPDALGPFELPDPKLETDISAAYFAGLFDGAGRFSPTVSKLDQHELGYMLSVHARLQRAKLDAAMRNRLLSFLSEHGINNTDYYYEDADTFQIVVQNRESLEDLITMMEPHLVSRLNDALVVRDEIIPMLDSEQHHSKDGFVGVLRLMDQTIGRQSGRGRERKYTAEYFEQLWFGES